MGFSSELYRNEIILNDEPETDFLSVPPDGCGRGLELDRPAEGFGYGDFARPFPDELLIPRSEWQARIEEMEETKSRLSDLIRHAKLPHKDQASTNYCWMNAPVHCLEISRLKQNQRTVILSPASGAAQIKGFRNVGGWGLEAVKWIAARGVNSVEDWPANAIDRKFATAENKASALAFTCDEWLECVPRNLDQMISLLLRRVPLAGGYNWWGHEVTNADPIWLDGEVAVRARNSWPNYGDFGFFVLQGRKMLADDLVGILNSRPS